MSLILKGKIWHYRFMVGAQRYQGSTGETQKGRAATVEAYKRAEASEGRLVPALRKMPTLAEFSVRFLRYVEESAHYTERGRIHYRYGVKLLKGSRVWKMRIDKITAEDAAMLQFPGAASGNQGLGALRRMLSMAESEGILRKIPKISKFAQNERTAIIEPWLEDLLLEKSRDPLRAVLTIMLDSFMRPSEVVGMRWENVLWDRNQIFIAQSKTLKGRRFVGMTGRMRFELQLRKPGGDTGWVFPSTGGKSGKSSSSGHTLASSLDKMFRTLKSRCLEAIAKRGLPAWPDGLVLYSCRHTGATNYSNAVGNNQLRVAAALGHTDLRTSRRYVHPADDAAPIMDRVVAMRKRA